LGCVVERCMFEAYGIVDVDGGAENVRDPRLPELRPLPIRASAPDARRPDAAATTAKTVRTR
jgi:hypothetical protein